GKIISEMVVDSKNKEIKQVYKYPKEMVAEGKDPEGVYNGMLNRNILAPVVESYSLYDNIQTSKEKTNYFKLGELYLPESIEQAKGTPNTNLEVRKVLYHHYDSSGNPIEVSTENGAHVVYLWGYNDIYPIAKI